MKNILRAAMAAIIGLSMVACGEHALDTLSGSNYHVTVNDGSGTGDYPAGSTVSISAIVPSGLQFAYWTVNSANATLTDANSPTTTFTMPASAVTVTANFTNGNGGVVINPSSSSAGGGGYTNSSSSSNGDKIGYLGYRDDTLARGTFESRRYKVEIWNIGNQATYDTLTKGVSLRDYVISKGSTRLDSLDNQTFSEVISKWNSLGVLGNGKTSEGVSILTDRLQTKKVGVALWLTNGSKSRYFNVGRTSEGVYTVKVYDINSATFTHLYDTYNGKTGFDFSRAYLTSIGRSRLNTYTNQTFSGVKTVLSSDFNNIGMDSKGLTSATNSLTKDLQTDNRNIWGQIYYSGSTYRAIIVEQE